MEVIELIPSEGVGPRFLNLAHVIEVVEHEGRETHLRLSTGEVVRLEVRVSDFLAKTKTRLIEEQFKLAPGQGAAFLKAWERMAQQG